MGFMSFNNLQERTFPRKTQFIKDLSMLLAFCRTFLTSL